jgi:type IV fimbrial biogenesis protein FimT
MKKEYGFTLIEITVAMSIFILLLGLMPLSYFSISSNLALNGGARKVLGDLLSTRMKAINQNNNFKVIFLNNKEYLILDDDDGDGIADAGESREVKNLQTNYPYVTLSSTDNPVFSPQGTANSTSTITLTGKNGSTKTVSVRISGHVKID